MSSIVVMTGGGMKGAVAAARCAKDQELVLLHVDYGQASADSEANALAALVPWFPKARLASLCLPTATGMQRIATAGSSASSTPGPGRVRKRPAGLPADSYAGLGPGGLRGLFPDLVSTAVQTALGIGATSVVTGLTRSGQGEHLGLPPDDPRLDRRGECVHAFNIMLDALLKPQVNMCLETPLMDLSYGDVVKLGGRLGVPFEKTWTCLGAGPRPCDTCGPCKARGRAFAEAGLPDPAMTALAF